MKINIKKAVRSVVRRFGWDLRRDAPHLRRLHNFSLDTRRLALLPKELLAPTRVTAPRELPEYPGRIFEVWRNDHGGRKWMHYFPVYERAFSGYVGTPVRFLEIGVQSGDSLRMWRSYFGPDSVIVGIDIDEKCAEHNAAQNNIHVRIGSQVDPVFLRRVVEEFGPFDAILDDGSHISSHLIRTFGQLFENGLKPQGVYVVEDTVATYWPRYRDIPFAFSEFCRDLSDLMCSPFWNSVGAEQFELGDPSRHKDVLVPRLGTLVERVEMSMGTASIYKAASHVELPVSARGRRP